MGTGEVSIVPQSAMVTYTRPGFGIYKNRDIKISGVMFLIGRTNLQKDTLTCFFPNGNDKSTGHLYFKQGENLTKSRRQSGILPLMLMCKRLWFNATVSNLHVRLLVHRLLCVIFL